MQSIQAVADFVAGQREVDSEQLVVVAVVAAAAVVAVVARPPRQDRLPLAAAAAVVVPPPIVGSMSTLAVHTLNGDDVAVLLLQRLIGRDSSSLLDGWGLPSLLPEDNLVASSWEQLLQLQ